MFSYEIYQPTDTTYAFKIINNETKEVIIDQHVNPETGQPFMTESEVKEYANQMIKQFNEQEMQSVPPYMDVKFEDVNGNPITTVEIGDPINVRVELFYTNGNEKVYAPVTGDYIVPYYYADSDVPAGSVLVHIENGLGRGSLNINQSGIFEIKLDKILNAETMKQPSPLPRLLENPRIAVVEKLATK